VFLLLLLLLLLLLRSLTFATTWGRSCCGLLGCDAVYSTSNVTEQPAAFRPTCGGSCRPGSHDLSLQLCGNRRTRFATCAALPL
jgi:hypothetical protein